MISGIVKGDSITLEAEICMDITGWKIRADFKDDSLHEIKLATVNVTGGSDNQIKIISTGASESVFEIYVKAGDTSNFDDQAEIEIEVETGNQVGGEPEKKTIFKGAVDFDNEIITWEDIS